MASSYRSLSQNEAPNRRSSEETLFEELHIDDLKSLRLGGARRKCSTWLAAPVFFVLALFLAIAWLANRVHQLQIALLKQPILYPSTRSGNHSSLVPDDIVLTLKTGASVMHKRLPVHFDNELSHNASLPRTDNLLLYSDYPDIFRNITVVDALANVSNAIRKQPAFQPYFVQQKQISEGVTVDKLDGSWSLDKYKFLPILRHAYTAFPSAKWFINMEADTYVFYSALVRLLESLSSDGQVLLGSGVEDGAARVFFPHGGSGYVLSKGLMDATYGHDRDFERRMDRYSKNSCCGDEILARALFRDKHIRIRAPEPAFDSAFTGETPYSQRFTKQNWCDPIYSFHHVTVEDIAELWEFEQDFWPRLYPDDTIRFVDVFEHFSWDFLRNGTNKTEIVRDGWENRCEDVVVPAEEGFEYDKYFCSEKCDQRQDCWAWQYKEGECVLGLELIRLGNWGPRKSTIHTSGVRMDRLNAFRKTQRCEGRPMRPS